MQPFITFNNVLKFFRSWDTFRDLQFGNIECSYLISLCFLVKPNADETVRVVNYHTSHRHLLRGFKRKVEDIVFESFKSNRLACIDSEGTVFVFNIYESGEDIKYLFNYVYLGEQIAL